MGLFDGYCSTVQGLLDWVEVDLGFTWAFIYSNRFVCSVSSGLKSLIYNFLVAWVQYVYIYIYMCVCVCVYIIRGGERCASTCISLLYTIFIVVLVQYVYIYIHIYVCVLVCVYMRDEERRASTCISLLYTSFIVA